MSRDSWHDIQLASLAFLSGRGEHFETSIRLLAVKAGCYNTAATQDLVCRRLCAVAVENQAFLALAEIGVCIRQRVGFAPATIFKALEHSCSGSASARVSIHTAHRSLSVTAVGRSQLLRDLRLQRIAEIKAQSRWVQSQDGIQERTARAHSDAVSVSVSGMASTKVERNSDVWVWFPDPRRSRSRIRRSPLRACNIRANRAVVPTQLPRVANLVPEADRYPSPHHPRAGLASLPSYLLSILVMLRLKTREVPLRLRPDRSRAPMQADSMNRRKMARLLCPALQLPHQAMRLTVTVWLLRPH